MKPSNPFSQLPSMDLLLSQPASQAWQEKYSPAFVKQCLRDILQAFRQKKLAEPYSREQWIERTMHELEKRCEQFGHPRLRPVINATGVILHTGLGRAPYAAAAQANVARIMAGYSNLELDMESGKRGERTDHIESLLCGLCGAEAAAVVNNNAAAVLLALNTLCFGKEAIISRGQLIEIGGSFRLPDVMEKSGTRMKEVGTTNKTRLKDYEKAISAQTGAIVVAHTSNYRVLGFTEEPALPEIVEMAHKQDVPVIHDLGGGVLVDLRRLGLPHEPLVQESLAAGVDLVTFSGDKILGGPQAGLLVGAQKWIEMIHKNALMRALRCDKLVYAALEATLRLYYQENKVRQDLPTLRMLSEGAPIVLSRCQHLLELLHADVIKSFAITIRETKAQAGSGALPLERIASYGVVLARGDGKSHEWAARLRRTEVPVVGYIEEDTIVLDLRTVQDAEVETMARMINQVFFS